MTPFMPVVPALIPTGSARGTNLLSASTTLETIPEKS
jgi:hypothetical protein